MKFAFFSAALVALPLVAAHDMHAHNLHARLAKRVPQAPPAPSPPRTSTTSTGSVAGPSPTSTSSASAGSPTAATPAPPAGPPVTQSASGVPALSAITSGAPPDATDVLSTTYTAGATPPISGAPPLPTFVFKQSDFPPLDKVPDTTAAEVQEWMKELNGFDIPNLNPTADGSCVGDPVAAADAANRGWWTCGGYTRSTDVVACPDKLTWGMSFDDGPSPNTPKLMKFLSQKDLSATFFVVGSRAVSYPDILRAEYMEGHEISVHTWSHTPLTKQTTEQIVAELGYTRKAIQMILGVTPTTMRPPYGDIDDRVRAISLAMGMVPIIWTRGPQNNQFDTNDWKVPGGVVTGPQSFQSFLDILGNVTEINTGFIVLEHDLYPQTVDLAVGYTLNAALNFQPKLTMESIGECQGWPAENMYLETTKNGTFPYLNSTAADSASTTASERAAQATGAASGKGGSSNGATSTVRTWVSGAVGMAAGLVLAGGLALL